MEAQARSIGYVPPSFPRDPVDVNQYDEHIILGQILEPLIDADGNGQIVPGIASSWKFSNAGKQIEFTLNTEIKFSNGKNISAEDAVYSIERHLKSDSQSKHFLADIERIETKKASELTIHLKRPNVSILKALTRDQLGIVPKGWVFKPDSDEPFIATGAYRLVRKGKDWHLIANAHFKKEKVAVPEWKILFFQDKNFSIPEQLPELVAVSTQGVLDQIKARKDFASARLQITPRLSFSQTSLWIHPKGTLYSDLKARKHIQSLLSGILDDYVNAKNLNRSTGVVPVGIQGSLQEPQKFPLPSAKQGTKIRIAALKGVFSPFFAEDQLRKIKDKYGLEITVQFFSPLELKDIQSTSPDVITGSWAGGFNDPAGFLALLNQFLGQDLKSYIGDMKVTLEKAEAEQDWSKRAQLYRDFGQGLIDQGFLIPGWRVPTYEVRTPELKYRESQARYSPRLINYYYEIPQ